MRTNPTRSEPKMFWRPFTISARILFSYSCFTFSSRLASSSRSSSTSPAKSLICRPFWSVMTMFSAARPATASSIRRCTPFDLLAVGGEVRPRLRRDDDRGRGRVLVLAEQLRLGHHEGDADVVHVVEGEDVLLELLGDGPLQVDVALEVRDGPALHVEEGPRVRALRDQVLLDQEGLGPAGGLRVGDVEDVVGAQLVAHPQLVELGGDLQARVLVGDRRRDQRLHRRLGAEHREQHDRQDPGADHPEQDDLLRGVPALPEASGLIKEPFQPLVHVPSPA